MDPVPEVLARALARAPVPLGEGDAVLVLGVGPVPAVDTLGPVTVDVVDPWASTAEAWASHGHTVEPDEDGLEVGRYALALVRPERQVAGRQARLARALRSLRPDGVLLVSLPNREGGKRLPAELEALGAEVLGDDSKSRCRYVWARRGDALDPEALDAVIADDAPRPVLDGLLSRPGLFSWDAVDPGTRLLAETLPDDDLGATVADAGAGQGWLSARILERATPPRRLHVLEADHRALSLAVQNLAEAGDVIRAHHVDASQPWPVKHLDAVVTNPPFHRQGEHDVALTEAILRQATRALLPGGRLWAVAKVNIPLSRMLDGLLVRVEERASRDGFRVVRGIRSSS